MLGNPRAPHRIAVVPAESSPQRVEVSAGLLEPRHLAAIGPALGLYLVLIAWKPYGTPFVRGGRPVPLWTLCAATGDAERTIRAHLRRLEAHGYIAAEHVNRGPRHGSGLRVRITKAKDWHAGALRVYLEPEGEPRQKLAAVPRQKLAGATAATASPWPTWET